MGRILGCFLGGLLAACSRAPNTKFILQQAEKAMGNVQTIQYSAAGVNGNFGQALSSGAEWPRRAVTAYTRTINYDQKSSSEQIAFAQDVFGGRKQNAQVNGDKAWNGGPEAPIPQLPAAEERQLQICITPHGFVKAALMALDAKVDSAAGGISFTALGKYKLTGYFNDSRFLTRVETSIADPLLGDMPLTIAYSNYKEFRNTVFPTKILQSQGGFPVWDLTVSNVRVNLPAEIQIPEAVRNARPPQTTVHSSNIADGVWFLAGGTHHSLLVEFKDYAVVVEAPLNEERSLAVLAEAQRLIPNKPVKYVVNTHHHFDHAGGLRTYVAQGATVITHESNKDYFENIFQRPATIFPDLLAKSPKPPIIQGVADKFVLTDGRQNIEVYTTEGDSHTDDLLIAYLRSPKILAEADSYTPQDPDGSTPSPASANAIALYNNIQRLKLNVSTIAPIHGRGAVTMAEFKKFVGKS
jgi:glyoxylase-like metal-dependent hydrolase (beta-lactamase superfamily II)